MAILLHAPELVAPEALPPELARRLVATAAKALARAADDVDGQTLVVGSRAAAQRRPVERVGSGASDASRLVPSFHDSGARVAIPIVHHAYNNRRTVLLGLGLAAFF